MSAKKKIIPKVYGLLVTPNVAIVDVAPDRAVAGFPTWQIHKPLHLGGFELTHARPDAEQAFGHRASVANSYKVYNQRMLELRPALEARLAVASDPFNQFLSQLSKAWSDFARKNKWLRLLQVGPYGGFTGSVRPPKPILLGSAYLSLDKRDCDASVLMSDIGETQGFQLHQLGDAGDSQGGTHERELRSKIYQERGWTPQQEDFLIEQVGQMREFVKLHSVAIKSLNDRLAK